MEKKQLIHLLQFILAWVLLWLFVVFVLKESFVNFVLNYRLYLLIVSVSYFYYYSIQYEPDKKYELIRNVLVYGNVYLFLHLFFRPLLNISHQLFVLLWLIFLWLWWSYRLKSRRRYLLQILGRTFSFFILISGMFYFYPDAPDVEWFIKSRSTQLLFVWVSDQVNKSDAYVQSTTSKWITDFVIVPYFAGVLSESQKISYPSIKNQRDEKVIIMTRFWDLVRLFPQSEIQIDFDWENVRKIDKLNWKIWFLSWIFESNIEVVGYEQELTQEQQYEIESIQDSYKADLISYLKNQIAESNIWWANNTIMYNIDGKIIWFLARMFPVTFGKNLRNYNEFQKYFSWVDEWVNLSKYSMSELEGNWDEISVWWYMKNNMNIGRNSIYGLFKKPNKR